MVRRCCDFCDPQLGRLQWLCWCAAVSVCSGRGLCPRRKPSPDLFWWNEGAALPVEGAIMEPLPYCTKSLGENPVQFLDERWRRLLSS
jgi:hypothetical protein